MKQVILSKLFYEVTLHVHVMLPYLSFIHTVGVGGGGGGGGALKACIILILMDFSLLYAIISTQFLFSLCLNLLTYQHYINFQLETAKRVSEFSS